MKSFKSIFAVVAMMGLLQACDKKDSKSETAQTPSTGCLTGDACVNGVYNYNASYGFSAYQQPLSFPAGTQLSWTASAAPAFNNLAAQTNYLFCGCAFNTRPVYNSQFGLGCVTVGAVTPFAQNAKYFSLQTSAPAINANNINSFGQQQPNCATEVMLSCTVGSSAGTNTRCVPTAPGASVGIVINI